ncbi:MAG: universal stress protein [Anaerolineales bacterium]|nr:universal stress protein [Anaerolineales bacterium]
MFQKILIPLDGTAHAEHAFHLAQTLAPADDGQLMLLHVLAQARESVSTHDLATAHRYLSDLHRTAQPTTRKLCTQLAVGDVASVIVDTATQENVDLLLMTAEGRLGFGRSILGGVAERVLRTAPCPMLVSRFPDKIQRVLITLDGSHLAEQALPLGLAVAQKLEAKVTLLQVEEGVKVAPSIASKWLERAEAAEERISERLATDAATYLQQAATKVGSGVKTAVLPGPVVSSIISYIETNHIDLVVMATHGFAGLSRWDYGHVTEKIMRGADTSLLITRPAPHQRIA